MSKLTLRLRVCPHQGDEITFFGSGSSAFRFVPPVALSADLAGNLVFLTAVVFLLTGAFTALSAVDDILDLALCYVSWGRSLFVVQLFVCCVENWLV